MNETHTSERLPRHTDCVPHMFHKTIEGELSKSPECFECTAAGGESSGALFAQFSCTDIDLFYVYVCVQPQLIEFTWEKKLAFH